MRAESIGAQVLVRRPRPLPWGFAYAPRGPVARTWSAEEIAAFTERVRTDLPRAAGRVSHLRIDPEIELDGPHDPDGALRRGPARGRLAPGPADPAGLDPGHRPARGRGRRCAATCARSGASTSTRRRTGGVVVVDAEGDRLGEFYRIYRETADRAGFLIRTESAYRDVWEAYRPAGRARLLFAQIADGEPLATLFLVRCGPRVVEPYGGMTQAGADSRANYLLKWEAIRTSREQGATSYDLWGLATGGHRPLQDRVRRPRGPLHRGVGPRAEPVRSGGLRGRRSGPRLVGAPAPWPGRRRERVGVRERGGRGVNVRGGGARPTRRGPTGTAGRAGPGRPCLPVAGLGGTPRGPRLAAALPAVRRRLRGPCPAAVVAAHRRLERLPPARSDRAPGEAAETTADRLAAVTDAPGRRGRGRPRDRCRDPGRRPATGSGSARRASGRSPRSSRRAIGSRCRSADATDDDIRGRLRQVDPPAHQRRRTRRPAGRALRHGRLGGRRGPVRGARRVRSARPCTASTRCSSRPAAGAASAFGPRTAFVPWWQPRPRPRPARLPRGERRTPGRRSAG